MQKHIITCFRRHFYIRKQFYSTKTVRHTDRNGRPGNSLVIYMRTRHQIEACLQINHGRCTFIDRKSRDYRAKSGTLNSNHQRRPKLLNSTLLYEPHMKINQKENILYKFVKLYSLHDVIKLFVRICYC